MYVKCERDGLKSICLEDMDSRAEFSKNNIAQVTESDGTTLIEKHPETFSEHDN